MQKQTHFDAEAPKTHTRADYTNEAKSAPKMLYFPKSSGNRKSFPLNRENAKTNPLRFRSMDSVTM